MATATPPPQCQSVFTYSHSSSAPRHSPCTPSQTLDYAFATSTDELSSSDKENSTSVCHSALHKNSPPTIVEDSTKHTTVSFTPRRVKPPPRAWERRPATPFLSRNEGQKIWKRVPLSDLNAEGSTQLKASRRQKEEREDYVRVVKRMRTDTTGIEVGNQASFSDHQSFGTKWEEDTIEQSGSPKKKQRVETVEKGETYEQAQTNSTMTPRAGSNQPVAEELVLETNSSADFPTQSCAPALDTSRPSQEQISQADVDATPDTSRDQFENLATAVSTCEEFESEYSHIPLAGSLTIMRDIPTQDVACNAELLEDEEHQNDSDMGKDVFAQQPEHSSPSKIIDSTTDQADTEHDLMINGKDNHTQDLSTRPAISAESALELSSPLKFSSSPDQNIEFVGTAHNTNCMGGLASQDTSTSIQSSTVYHGTDHEDTAFLHDFLLRARASKAAREMASPPRQAIQSDEIIDDLSITHSVNQQVSASAGTETVEAVSPSKSVAFWESDIATEEQLSSPVRRSARAAARANTKPHSSQTLPLVPQFGPVLASQTSSLPNTIQLKRATGTEFVFNAKMQQTLAMTTRSNTKRNHSGAINVTARLAQLKAEQICKTKSFLVEPADPQDACNEPISIIMESPVKTKRHKRNKDDAGKKSKKMVKWHEVLASYREATPSSSYENEPTSDDFAGVEAAAQAEALRSMTDSFAIPASNAMEQSSEQGEDRAGGQSDSSKLKVRKMRKFSVGSVNGTPAPKTRSQKTRPVSASSALSMQSGIPKMGSRMPVPISSSSSSSSNLPVMKDPAISTTIPTPVRKPASSKKDDSFKHDTIPNSTTSADTEQEQTMPAAAAVTITKQDRSAVRKSMTGRRVLRGRS